MSTLLKQFVIESRDILQNLAEGILLLEKDPENEVLIQELFRSIHTLKGNSGLFDFQAMNQILHSSEDLMVAIREGTLRHSREIADQLLNVLDFVSVLLDEIERSGSIKEEHAKTATELSNSITSYVPKKRNSVNHGKEKKQKESENVGISKDFISGIPEEIRISIFKKTVGTNPLYFVLYQPEEECFFKGEDPFYLTRNVPGLLWGGIHTRGEWPPLIDFDCYRCFIDFSMLSTSTREELLEYFKFIAEQVQVIQILPCSLIIPTGRQNGGPVYGDFVSEASTLLEKGELNKLKAASQTLIELSSPELWLSSALRWLLVVLEVAPTEKEVIKKILTSIESFESPDFTGLGCNKQSQRETPIPPVTEQRRETKEYSKELLDVLETQLRILTYPEDVAWFSGRLQACYNSIKACITVSNEPAFELDNLFEESLKKHSAIPLQKWLTKLLEARKTEAAPNPTESQDTPMQSSASSEKRLETVAPSKTVKPEIKFGRRAEDQPGGRVLKVDQTKIERLMNIVGELVVAKNSIPYLSYKAEKIFGSHNLSRELKALYGNMNRLSDELQDIVMKVRMVPFSLIFQRFPRLVRDVSLKLGKEVTLLLEGEDIEADKNIIDAIADPLIHIIRNCLDHGIEHPKERQTVGKPKTGTIALRAIQESDRILVEVSDDGRGIDSALLKRKAYEKGLIDENQFETLGEKDALNLIFISGFSTVENATDLSGRGVGMDAVKNTLDKLGGSIEVQSGLGKGTLFRLSIPLSMAVTNVMVVESNKQSFGVSMSCIAETLRIPEHSIHFIKDKKTTVVRNKIIPLTALNDLLGIPKKQKTTSDHELSVLIIHIDDDEPIGLIVDDFREVIDVILKPLEGTLAKLSCYAGTALLGDGSVLMVLNMKELLKCL